MFTAFAHRGWYPKVNAGTGQQSSNCVGGGFNNWFWLSAFITVLLIVLFLLILHVYARCVLRRRRAATIAARTARGELPKPGLDSSIIASIPTYAYHCSGESDNECSVCLGEVNEGEVVREMPKCKHVFHVGCIDKWLKSHATCPVCRADAEPPKEAALPLLSGGSGEEVKEWGWKMWWMGVVHREAGEDSTC